MIKCFVKSGLKVETVLNLLIACCLQDVPSHMLPIGVQKAQLPLSLQRCRDGG